MTAAGCAHEEMAVLVERALKTSSDVPVRPGVLSLGARRYLGVREHGWRGRARTLAKVLNFGVPYAIPAVQLQVPNLVVRADGAD